MGVQGNWPLWDSTPATTAAGGAGDGPLIHTTAKINENFAGNTATTKAQMRAGECVGYPTTDPADGTDY